MGYVKYPYVAPVRVQVGLARNNPITARN